MRTKLPVLWFGCLLGLLITVAAGTLHAAEVIPSVPTRYFNDYAIQVSSGTADKLNRELEDFERQTSNQLRVCIYPKLQTDSDLADYCQRVARSWQVGQKDKRNGTILFVFVQDHKSNIQVGYGLEGVLPDATCEDILQDQIKPKLKAGDWDGGMTAGVESIMAATKGEFKGSGRTTYEQQHPGSNASTGGISFGAILFIFVMLFIIGRVFRGGGGGRGAMFGGGGPMIFPGSFGGGGGFGSGGGFGGGGSSSSSDGGGFASSGGGDFGGGGASGDW